VRAEVLALRAQLSTIPADRWQWAQVVFDQMTELCGVKGPSNGRMVPRACRVCGFYGHTKQHCELNKARKERMTERELELDSVRGYVAPKGPEECLLGPEQWEWIVRLRKLEARVQEGEAMGLGCKKPRTVTCAGDVVLDCDCSGCKEWKNWVGKREL